MSRRASNNGVGSPAAVSNNDYSSEEDNDYSSEVSEDFSTEEENISDRSAQERRKQAQLRQNEVERARRLDIDRAFRALQATIPTASKLARTKILKAASAHIRTLVQRESNLDQEVRTIKENNAILKKKMKKVRALLKHSNSVVKIKSEPPEIE